MMSVLRWRWLRWTVGVTVSVMAIGGGLMAVGASGGFIVRDAEGCPRSVGSTQAVEWVDIVHINDVTYERVYPRDDPIVEWDSVGEQIGAVSCTVGDAVQRAGYRFRNGESTFLPVESPLYTIRGVDPAFRIVALDFDITVVYQRSMPPSADTGADLLPFAAESVVSVAFLSPQDHSLLGRLTNTAEVTAFVEDLQSSDVDLGAKLQAFASGSSVFIALEFDDQPSVTLVADTDARVTHEGIVLSEVVLALLPPGT